MQRQRSPFEGVRPNAFQGTRSADVTEPHKEGDKADRNEPGGQGDGAQFSAYGVTSQQDDPLTQAMHGLINSASAQEHQIALLWQAIEKLSATAQAQRVVWAGTWTTAASRKVTIRVAGTTGRPRIDLDALVTAD